MTRDVYDGLEEYGLVAVGQLDHPKTQQTIEQIVKTLEFTAAAEPAAVGEVAAGLRDPDLRQQVRKRLESGWAAYDSENFILVTNCSKKAVIDRMLQDLEIMRLAYINRFPPVGELGKVSLVRVFSSYEQYASYSKIDGAIGHFSPLDDELVLFDPGTRITKRNEWLRDVDPSEVLYHEAMHQYLHEANGLLAPASWFDEGFGEVFGAAELDRARGQVKRIDKNKMRMGFIKRSQKTKRWPDLRAFVKMTQPDFYGPSVYQNYAFAWAFCHFLEQQRLEPKGNREWGAIPDEYLRNLREITDEHRKKMQADAPKDWIMGFRFEIQEQAFERTFAKTDWVALEKVWIEAMQKF